jgi:hypothetical protein
MQATLYPESPALLFASFRLYGQRVPHRDAAIEARRLSEGSASSTLISSASERQPLAFFRLIL